MTANHKTYLMSKALRRLTNIFRVINILCPFEDCACVAMCAYIGTLPFLFTGFARQLV